MKKKIFVIVLVVILIGIIVFGGVLLLGCTPIHFHSKAEDGQIKVACVGDSLTYGMLVFNPFANSYPIQLGKMLGDDYHVLNFGHSGATACDDVADSYRKTLDYKQSIDYQPNVVIIMLGSNDSKYHIWKDKDHYKQELVEIINIYKDLPSVERIILGIPNAGFCVGNKKDYNYDISIVNLPLVVEGVKEVATEYGYQCVDTYELTKNHPEWYKLDGVHPNADGAKAMAELFCEAVIA